MLDFNIDIDKESIIFEENINDSFRELFGVESFSFRIERKNLENIDKLFSEKFAPKKSLSFNIELNSNSFLTDYDFIKEFNLQTFDISLDKSKIVNDLIFEEYFKIEEEKVEIVEEPTLEIPENEIFQFNLDESKFVNDLDFEEHFKLEQKYDYNIIENLKKDFNSRKIVTREEREKLPEIEPIISSITETESIEQELEKSKSVIKENSFYKIVEITPSEIPEIPPKVDNSYQQEVEKKLEDMEDKYEDLLQKTKDDYESRLNKMVKDFSNFRDQITHQVTRMSLISSSSAGGGAVRILDMDDVDPSLIADGRTLIWNSEKQKFELEAFRSQSAEVFEVTQDVIDKQYVDLEIPAASELYNLATLELNGLVNYHPLHFTFDSQTRVNLEKLNIVLGDIIRVIYTRA